MTKLEQKLIELGYQYNGVCWYKRYPFAWICLYRTEKPNHIINPLSFISNQQNIDNLQQVLIQMQRDLEVLKKYENK